MDSSRFQSIRHRLTPQNLRTSLRRSLSSASSTSSGTSRNRDSFGSAHSEMTSTSSPANTINSVLFRQQSIADLEAEKRSSGISQLSLLEPRPIVYWGGVEERIMGSF